MKDFNGKVLFLDRSDINTDEIIPAKYLTEIDRNVLGPHCLEDLSLEGFDPSSDVLGKRAVVTRKNFGCGSSREHAPWALEANGITIVFAQNFARIFRQNMFNCGLIAAELSETDIDSLFHEFKGDDVAIVSVDLDEMKATFVSQNNPSKKVEVVLNLSDFEKALVGSGGWLEYADSKY